MRTRSKKAQSQISPVSSQNEAANSSSETNESIITIATRRQEAGKLNDETKKLKNDKQSSRKITGRSFDPDQWKKMAQLAAGNKVQKNSSKDPFLDEIFSNQNKREDNGTKQRQATQTIDRKRQRSKKQSRDKNAEDSNEDEEEPMIQINTKNESNRGASKKQKILRNQSSQTEKFPLSPIKKRQKTSTSVQTEQYSMLHLKNIQSSPTVQAPQLSPFSRTVLYLLYKQNALIKDCEEPQILSIQSGALDKLVCVQVKTQKKYFGIEEVLSRWPQPLARFLLSNH